MPSHPRRAPQSALRGVVAVTLAGVVAALVLFHASPTAAQAAERVLFVTVLDDKGAPVTAVEPADLVVREDGVAREVLRVTPATGPMHVVLLVDNSQAATAEVQNLRDGLEVFVAALTPANEVALATLGDRPTSVVDATTDAARLRRGLGRLFAQPGSGVYLLDALVETSKALKKRQPPRPVIVSVTTDGVEFSNANHLQVLDALEGTYATYTALVIRVTDSAEMGTSAIRDRAIVLDRGTSEHGGERVDLLTSLALRDALGRLADQLTHQVQVTYARPVSLIPPSTVTVAAVRPGWKARGVPARTK